MIKTKNIYLFSLFKQSGILEYCLSLLGETTIPELAASILNLLSSATDQNKDVSEKVSFLYFNLNSFQYPGR